MQGRKHSPTVAWDSVGQHLAIFTVSYRYLSSLAHLLAAWLGCSQSFSIETPHIVRIKIDSTQLKSIKGGFPTICSHRQLFLERRKLLLGVGSQTIRLLSKMGASKLTGTFYPCCCRGIRVQLMPTYCHVDPPAQIVVPGT